MLPAYAVADTPQWVLTLRRTIHDEGFREGWSVMQRRRRVHIQPSYLTPDGIRFKIGVSTQIGWAAGCTSEVLAALNL